ncbi:hypothetical protein HYX02_01920 [Candidatus Woesearchaeota archaeon]|nr:hypothetical protein [Candidatus Woesearchaeota archaeon]
MGFWDFFYSIVPDVWFRGMNLRSYTGIILVDAIKGRRRDRALRVALKRIKKRYNADKLAGIYQKYSNVKQKNPAKMERARIKFERKLQEFMLSFVAEWKIVEAYFLDALKLIDQSLISSKREGKKELTDVEVVFAGLDKRANELKFPRREVVIFKGQLYQMLYDLQKSIRKDELSDLRLERGGYPVNVSAFSFRIWWSRRKAYRKTRNEARKLNEKIQLLNQVLDRIIKQIQSGEIRQNLLFLVIEFCKLVDAADASLEEIKQDLELVLKKLRDELEQVKTSLNNLLLLLRNEPEIRANSEFTQIGQKIAQLEQVIQQIPRQDFRNTEALRVLLQMVLREEASLLPIMEKEAIAA